MLTLPSSEMLSISRILAESSFSSAPSILYVTVEAVYLSRASFSFLIVSLSFVIFGAS